MESPILTAPAAPATPPIDFSAIHLAPGAVDAVTKAPAGPVQKDLPGIGTITVTPKAIPNVPAKATGGVGDNAAGLYARTGVTPPPPDVNPNAKLQTQGFEAPKVPGLPSYPAGSSAATGQSYTEAYNAALKSMTDIETKIKSSATPSDQETTLQKQLDAAKANLAQFDITTLQSEEDLHGQGRGATQGTINTQQTILDRTRALERLGLATDANTIATQLSTASDARKAAGDLATTEYNLATKRLDMALNVADKMETLSKDDQQNARQYLLDVVNFADGKSYDKLDTTTQAAITHAVANSPITLDMVKTALQSGADKAAASAQGNLRSVAGVGVVQITQDKSGNITGYKVVVPENPQPSPSSTAPAFDDYLAKQGIPLLQLTKEKIAQVRAEYDAKYGNTNVNLGKLTSTNKNDLAQAGLSGAAPAVQSYFLNAPAAFRDSYQRDVASGAAPKSPALSDITSAYTTWYNAQSGSANDWASIIKSAQAGK